MKHGYSKRRNFARIWFCDRGAIAVEWALIAPVLLIALVGAVDLGAVAIHRMQMENAMRSGLQYASIRKPVSGDMSGVEGAVKDAAPPDDLASRQVAATYYCECPEGITVDCATGCETGTTSRYVRIVMTEKYQPFLRLLPILPELMDMRVEGNIRIN